MKLNLIGKFGLCQLKNNIEYIMYTKENYASIVRWFSDYYNAKEISSGKQISSKLKPIEYRDILVFCQESAVPSHFIYKWTVKLFGWGRKRNV